MSEVRAFIREYAKMPRLGLTPADRLLFGEGPCVWLVNDGSSNELLACGAKTLDAHAVAPDGVWIADQPKGFMGPYRIGRLREPWLGAAAGVEHETWDLSFPDGAQSAVNGRVVAFRTEESRQLEFGVVDLETRTFESMGMPADRIELKHGLVAACCAAGTVCVLDATTLRRRFLRELGHELSIARVVVSSERVAIYAIGGGYRALLDGADGHTLWERKLESHLNMFGSGLGRIWEYDEARSELQGVDIETGEIRERFGMEPIPRNESRQVLGWQGRLVEYRSHEDELQIRDVNGRILQMLKLPAPFHVSGYSPVLLGEQLVVPLWQRHHGHRESLHGLLWLSLDERVPKGIRIEPRPPQAIEKIATSQGKHGYRLALRCSEPDELVRNLLLSLWHLAYDHCGSAEKRGTRGFDGSVQVAIDLEGLQPDLRTKIDAWLEMWTAHMKGMMTAPGGKRLRAFQVAFAPEMLADR